MSHKLGLHWILTHPTQADLQHIERVGHNSVKLFEHHWSNRDAVGNLLAVLPKDSYILARDHPLSEQKEGIWSDPIAHGKYHADQWADKVRQGNVYTPLDRTFFLGVNEPDATHGDRRKIDIYTASFLDRLREHGLRGGAFNFSTGHPRTIDGTANTTADYTVFERSHQSIVRGAHIAIAHIYGTAAVPLAPGHYDRLAQCKWRDVEWVIGECGIDEHVIGGGEHKGYLDMMSPANYPAWMQTFMGGVLSTFPRIHSFQFFTYDFSHPWGSFNVKEAAQAIEQFEWRDYNDEPSTPDKPVDKEPPAMSNTFFWPVTGPVTQEWGQNPGNYARFNIPGHNGIDFGVPMRTLVKCVADGIVSFSGTDDSYGNYVRVWHPHLRIHTFYAHLDKALVAPTMRVNARQGIGSSGNTGNSTGPHLHFEVRLGTADGGYATGTHGYGKGRIDPRAAYHLLNRS